MPEVSSIGKYQIFDRIATGDLAEIFKARLDGIAGFRRTFAIKRVRPHLARNQAYAAMIEEEARIAGLLSHGNIVQLLDLGRDGGALYLVMEFVDGWDLGAVEARSEALGRPVPVPVVVHVGVELLKALEYAHAREIVRHGEVAQLGLIHRDISPSNILVSRQGEVKLTDFGIARASLKLMETHPDLVRRTFDYMSPEASRGHDLTQAADLFAVGVVLFELLTGTHPFRREGEMATLEAIQDGHTPDPAALRPDAPAALLAAIARAMASDPAQRHPNATAFKDDLLAVEREVAASEGAYAPQTVAADELRTLFQDVEPGALSAPTSASSPSEELPDLPEEGEHTLPANYLASHLGDADGAPDGELDDLATDDATAIGEVSDLHRPSPLGGQPMPTPPPKRNFSDDEAATVVNLELARRLEELRAERMAAKAAENRAPRSEPTRAAPPPPSLPAPERPAVGAVPGPTAGSPVVTRTRTPAPVPVEDGRSRLTGFALGLGVLTVGAVLGGLITLFLQSSGTMLVTAPHIEVRGDPGVAMTVTLDGQPLSPGAHAFEPGTHAVHVEIPGAQPWDFDLDLHAGEYRVIVLSSHDVQADPKAAAPR
jgi:serine/threonine protein kinase